jgi:hypothetical protein
MLDASDDDDGIVTMRIRSQRGPIIPMTPAARSPWLKLPCKTILLNVTSNAAISENAAAAGQGAHLTPDRL